MNSDLKNTNTVRTRFAPSPTGELHIGSARTALFNYLFARKNKGDFLVRIEDTDQSRRVKDSELRMLELIKWLGIGWDKEPVYQSSRLSLYKEYARKLIKENKAYYCFCSEEHLEKIREEQKKKGIPTHYDRTCRNLSAEGILQNLKDSREHVIRLKVPEKGKIKFNDLIRGEIEFDFSVIDDQILLKSDGFPTYHLAAVVDDFEQGITDILRGEEWLSSTPKHLLLYQYFGWKAPRIAHLPVIVGKDKKKLSKREGSVSVDAFKKEGYLPEAIINFIALLGWNPGDEREFFTMENLEKEFDISKVNKSPSLFDTEKLNYFNGYYIRKNSDEDICNLIKNFSKIKLEKYENDFLKKIIKIVKNRMVTLNDFDKLSHYFFKNPEYKKDLLKFKKSLWDDTKKGLKKAVEKLENANESAWNSEGVLNDIILRVVEESGLKNGDIFWPIRVSLSGEEKSPSPIELLWALGREESLKRLRIALGKIK